MNEPSMVNIAKMEAEVLQNVQDTLGELATLPDEIASSYGALARAFSLVWSSFTNHQVDAFMFLLQSLGHQVKMGALTLMRGHPTDSTSFTRKSIEIVAFCLEILSESDSAKRWLEIGTTKSAMKRYTSRFSAFKMVTEHLKSKDPQLISAYETYCLSVHPGLASVSRQAVRTTEDYEFDHFEVSSQEHHDALKVQYLLAMTMHVRMIDVLTKTLEEMKLPLSAEFHSSFERVKEKVEAANLDVVKHLKGL